MRRVLLSRNRVDFVATLLQQGRLADMLLHQHFSAGHIESPIMKAVNIESNKDNNNTKDNNNNNNNNKSPTALAREVLIAKREAVRVKAMSAPSQGWLAEAYNINKLNIALPHSRETVKAKVSQSDPTRVTLRGTFMAVDSNNNKDNNNNNNNIVRLAASTETGEAVMLTLPLSQSSDKIIKTNSKTHEGSTLRTFTLTDAEASININEDNTAAVETFIAEQFIFAAAACSGILSKLQEICALHATHTIRYDALFVRNPAVQKRLSQLACAQFAIDALTSFVAESSVESPINIIEAFTLCLHAKWALTDALQHTRELMHGSPLRISSTNNITKIPHRSKPERMIDYAYASELFENEHQLLSSFDAATPAQVMRYIAPLLSFNNNNNNNNNNNEKNKIYEEEQGGLLGSILLGIGSNPTPHLAAPHVNLRISSAVLEKDIATLLTRIKEKKQQSQKQQLQTDPLFIMAVAQYVMELFANIAVVYKSSASLTQEKSSAPRDWLLAQSFCADSHARRADILHNCDATIATRAALGKLKVKEINNCTTHPVELMNAEPIRKTTTTTTTEGKASVAGESN